eukprot:m.54855 g.54855  ORF g.54855 m.54855 type:complete len:383 (+) comp10955_c0_seq2:197-1345(+)
MADAPGQNRKRPKYLHTDEQQLPHIHQRGHEPGPGQQPQMLANVVYMQPGEDSRVSYMPNMYPVQMPMYPTYMNSAAAPWPQMQHVQVPPVGAGHPAATKRPTGPYVAQAGGPPMQYAFPGYAPAPQAYYVMPNPGPAPAPIASQPQAQFYQHQHHEIPSLQKPNPPFDERVPRTQKPAAKRPRNNGGPSESNTHKVEYTKRFSAKPPTSLAEKAHLKTITSVVDNEKETSDANTIIVKPAEQKVVKPKAITQRPPSSNTTTSTNTPKDKPDILLKKKSKKDPNLPKRALTSFVCFANEIRAILMTADTAEGQEFRSLGFGASQKKLAEMWRQAPPEVHHKYKEVSQRDKRRYQTELNLYKKRSLSQETNYTPLNPVPNTSK